MKGITHFVVGVAAASCFPQAVAAGANGCPLYFILGGVAGLLADTLDFKFYRFFHKTDLTVVPDPNRPDPQLIADAVAHAFNQAFIQQRPVGIKLNTIRLGTDLWQSYQVRFDVPAQRVVVTYGDRVDTGANPVETFDPRKQPTASAGLLCGVKLDYLATTPVDIWDGPTFRMQPTPDRRVAPCFIPWHREWSHSFPLALLFAALAAVLWGPLAGLVTAAAYAAHILLDQLGYLGSNLWFPFRSARIPGLQYVTSGDPAANAWTVWLAGLLVFWNLYRAMSWQRPGFNILRLFFYGALLPWALSALFHRLTRTRSLPEPGIGTPPKSVAGSPGAV